MTLAATESSLEVYFLDVGEGSSSSSYRWFVEKVNPRYAVISVGENNYGHPADIVLKNLKSVGAEIYRTDICGDIYCSSNGSEIVFNTGNKL